MIALATGKSCGDIFAPYDANRKIVRVMFTESRLRGFERILTTEVHVSDLLQELTDRDPMPWGDIIDMVPIAAHREHSFSKLKGEKRIQGSIDLLLESSDGDEVAIEVKVAHQFPENQRIRYESSTDGALVMIGMAGDQMLVDSYPRWTFRALADVFAAWSESSNQVAALLARIAAETLRRWDGIIDSVFRPATGAAKLDSLQEKFLAILVSRRLEHDLSKCGWHSRATVSKGSSGLALVQGFAALNGDEDRCLIAEARWVEGLRQINFRLGIDFSLDETRDTRAEAWILAKEMTDAIRIEAFQRHLGHARPDLMKLVTFRGAGGRNTPNDDVWLPVVERGLKDSSNIDGVPGPKGVQGTRQNVNPGFVGDGTLRFEASGQIKSVAVDAVDLLDLIDEALKYLCSELPDGYSAGSLV
ncbi:hypothetical protein AAFP32_10100 [Brevibacterium sp. CBA3109]|uniref:PD-(D/E)XK nuclease family protein n=1 Tax=Brevibacterium koreense TaxID=3140787 RepID=A0AAU7UI03_9MICO